MTDQSEKGPVDILDALRARISSHEIVPGSRLREQQLAEEFGVPRARVREAFTALEARGLIHRIPNRGAVVAQLDIEELVHIYDVREVLEGACARLAAERADDGAWDPLIELFGDPMQGYVDSNDFDSFVEGYERFRRETTTLASNPVLAGMLDGIYERTYVAIRRVVILPGRAQIGLREHRQVLDALAARDGVGAEALRRASIRSAKDYIVRYQGFVL
jgi:DNA-binding GntR family transcriptional regulator